VKNTQLGKWKPTHWRSLSRRYLHSCIYTTTK